MKNLKQLIKTKKTKIAVVGLGYVGIPVACLFANKGFDVLGFDIQKKKILLINKGINPIEGKEPGLKGLLKKVVKKGNLKATTNIDLLRNMDVIIVAVETPIESKTHEPKYIALKSACKAVGKNLTAGSMVIIESTIAPTTIDKVVKPILEKQSKMKAGYDFYLVNCPERVMPGKLLKNLIALNRVIGVSDKKTGEIAKLLYKNIVKGKLDVVDNLTAEVVKTVENTYRDVQIAFANEIALICEELGVDFYKVRDLVYWPMLLPGAGVGGHCIPKDPWLLVYGVKGKLIPKLIPLSRKINDLMPIHLADLVKKALNEKGLNFKKAKISILGIAYLENSDDTRNSPAISLYFELKKRGARNISTHDPYVKDLKKFKVLKDIDKAVRKSDCLVVVTAHNKYKNLNLKKISKLIRTKIIIDGRNVFSKKEAEKLGFLYKGIGK